MVITMELKNVVLRGKTYHFRLRVPKDCVSNVGKKEVLQSLKTTDPLEARKMAGKLEADWTARFEEMRKPRTSPVKRCAAPVNDDAVSLKQKWIELAEKNLPAIMENETEAQLAERTHHYKEAIIILRKTPKVHLDFDELRFSWPVEPDANPGRQRQLIRILMEVLERMLEIVAGEMILPPVKSKEVAKKKAVQASAPSPCPEDHDILEVADLMLAAKRRIVKTQKTVKVDIQLLKEWTGNKRDITTYTKRDLIDFVQNCLPHLPANLARRGNRYAGKTLRECIRLTQSDPESYPPISHTTCGNRMVNITMVFQYAKEHLGIIPVNPAKGIEIPVVNVRKDLPKGFTPGEVAAMWEALQPLRETMDRRPSRYWATVLSLYHGFRLNEVCGLFLKDVYEDPDGIFVIDINAEGQFKSVKNKSSVRVVPVHPFVRDQLDFKGFVERQKMERTEGVLFHDVRGNEIKGYRDRMSKWFAGWKKEWLPSETQYKHFHDLRYTFTQTAQNVAKMPDRHAQEITGHSIEGVSAVHLAYSGRLKPVDLLPELEKVRYGWE